MSTNTLIPVNSGDTIIKSYWNDIHNALQEDFVGRNSSGAPTAGKRLGTPAVPWGNAYLASLFIGGVEVDFSGLVGSNRFGISSGRVRSTSNQPQFLDPAGAAGGLAFTLQATATDLELLISGTGLTITADIVKGSLSAAPAANNTALVNMAEAADQHNTRTFGEDFDPVPSIFIDTVGTEISSRVGKWAAFQIHNGAAAEYFLAYIKSATELAYCKRGYFYGADAAPVNAVAFADNDTITLLKAAWVFVDADGTTVDVTYNPPTYSANEPASPATDDYWFDLINLTWKKHNGSSFVTVSRVYVGIVASNAADCIAARSADFIKSWDNYNEMLLEKSTAAVVQGTTIGQSLSVAGVGLSYLTNRASWNMAANLAGSADMHDATEQASRFYYAYISDEGEEIISDIAPYFRPELRGFYHRHNPWRCVGVFFNNSSSDIDGDMVHSARYQPRVDPRDYSYTMNSQIFG